MSSDDVDEESTSLKQSSSRSLTLERDVSTLAMSKMDDEDDLLQDKPSHYLKESKGEGKDDVEEEMEDVAPSSFRLRLAEAQLTDSLSAAEHDNVDVMAEKVQSFLAQLVSLYI